MKKYLNESGFSLIEMLIVLLIVTVLLLITIPNVTKNSKSIDEKGCDAYVSMVQSQVEAYKLENKNYPQNFEELVEADFFPEVPICSDGTELTINDGEVSIDKEK